MKVQVVAYKNHLVIVPHEPEKGIEDGWYPTNKHRFGCVITDTKKNLGVSEEAFELMKSIKRNHDAIGDIGWWECDDGTHAFSWFGSVHRVIDPHTAEGDRTFRIVPSLKDACTIIPNDVPEEAKLAFAAVEVEGDEIYSWKEPSSF